jgi:hemerythrin-like metal-binding protein
MLTWTHALSVGVPAMDEQHRVLIDLTNRLEAAMRDAKGKEVLGEVLDALVLYVQTHFGAEERLMAAAGYPELAAHQAIHEAMTKQVLAIQQSHRLGRAALTVQTLKFLGDWVEKHIRGTDMRYAALLGGRS